MVRAMGCRRIPMGHQPRALRLRPTRIRPGTNKTMGWAREFSVLCNSTLQDQTNVGKIASISRASQVQAPVSISQCNESQKVEKSPKPRLSGPRLHMDIHHTILMLMDMDRRWAADGLQQGDV